MNYGDECNAMMVLRHARPPSAATVSLEDSPEEDQPASPMDLSKKHSRPSAGAEVPLHLSSKNPFISIIPSMRPPPLTRIHHNNNNNIRKSSSNLNNNNIISNCNNNNNNVTPKHDMRRARLDSESLRKVSPSDARWRELNIVQDGHDEDRNSYSSPDSGLHRDSPGEEEEIPNSKSMSPPMCLKSRSKTSPHSLIPLSLIRARYKHKQRGDGSGTPCPEDDPRLYDPDHDHDPDQSDGPPDVKVQVQTKRARLEEMVTHLKSSRGRRYSGDDDTSSGGHVTSGDEVADDGPTDLRNLNYRMDSPASGKASAVSLNLSRDGFRVHDDDMDEEPCNLVCPKVRADSQSFDTWKHKVPEKTVPPLSPSDAAKIYGMDPEAYQQQILQLQLTSAAMLGDPGGLLKSMGAGYPPWVYLGYYSQLFQNFQAQEILRQYAIQSQNLTPTVSQGEKSPSASRTIGSSGYNNCRSPLSPASLSEGPVTGLDSDNGSVVGQTTSGSANGKRAPRAMTGRHVRTGTGASPATLQTLRQKIEERQRMKAQQVSHDLLMQSQSKSKHHHNHSNNNNNNNSKYFKKSKK